MINVLVNNLAYLSVAAVSALAVILPLEWKARRHG